MKSRPNDVVHFKRKLPGGRTETRRVKQTTIETIKEHLVRLLEYGSQEMERVQRESGSDFAQLIQVVGSEKKAKCSFIEDRFDEAIVPWLEKKGVDPVTIKQFKENMLSAYLKILNRASVNSKINISTEFAANLRAILADVDVTQSLNPSSLTKNR